MLIQLRNGWAYKGGGGLAYIGVVGEGVRGLSAI